jgi:hypothetical protein
MLRSPDKLCLPHLRHLIRPKGCSEIVRQTIGTATV